MSYDDWKLSSPYDKRFYRYAEMENEEEAEEAFRNAIEAVATAAKGSGNVYVDGNGCDGDLSDRCGVLTLTFYLHPHAAITELANAMRQILKGIE